MKYFIDPALGLGQRKESITMLCIIYKYKFKKKGWFWWDGSRILKGLTTPNEHKVATFTQ